MFYSSSTSLLLGHPAPSTSFQTSWAMSKLLIPKISNNFIFYIRTGYLCSTISNYHYFLNNLAAFKT
jgi:hypothetical protein